MSYDKQTVEIIMFNEFRSTKKSELHANTREEQPQDVHLARTSFLRGLDDPDPPSFNPRIFDVRNHLVLPDGGSQAAGIGRSIQVINKLFTWISFGSHPDLATIGLNPRQGLWSAGRVPTVRIPKAQGAGDSSSQG